MQKDQGAAAYDFAEKMLTAMGMNPAQPALCMLRELLQMTSLQAKHFLLGVWLGRQDTPLRLVIRHLPLTKAEELIRNLPGPGWREFVLPHSDLLNSLGIRMVSPAIDMGEKVEKIGVEFFLGRQATSWEEEVQLCRGLLDWLVQTGMCLPEKRDAVS
ncbi:MAG: hypothetical protein GY703_06345, partial [Gammaproteobacteria bacterium]|nr:hypothetical protein [Gammaproteobacteria bacterium]